MENIQSLGFNKQRFRLKWNFRPSSLCPTQIIAIIKKNFFYLEPKAVHWLRNGARSRDSACVCESESESEWCQLLFHDERGLILGVFVSVSIWSSVLVDVCVCMCVVVIEIGNHLKKKNGKFINLVAVERYYFFSVNVSIE